MQRNFMSLLLLLMLFLYFSHLLTASAIPAATKTQNLKGGEDSSALTSLTRLDHGDGSGEDVMEIERRVDLETQDYEGTGANRDHDPKTPGGS
ncbi:uncharacterized protein LOC109802966 [Cajanus cajan]|uniref:uncharacterized protein LOC109802966 n=1 Tax=Cajanus cajan TaxID=3821 RepID=UPI00098DC244|nr:uncharacterized protein LOC109802966 [Cajanus cajan]